MQAAQLNDQIRLDSIFVTGVTPNHRFVSVSFFVWIPADELDELLTFFVAAFAALGLLGHDINKNASRFASVQSLTAIAITA